LGKKAIFLDRDGVLTSAGKVHTPEELIMLPGSAEAVKIMNEAGFETFVVTNQGGVGLGDFTRQDLDRIHSKLTEIISLAGGHITEIRACLHKPHARCYCRKPKPGMLQDLIREYDIDPRLSYMAGDLETDIRAGRKAGVRTVLIGASKPIHTKPDWSYPSLWEAAHELWKEGQEE
jgi:D-glycero-D-manno-heptose 1,7-bisphosphate phosphatase